MSRFHELEALKKAFANEIGISEADLLHAAAIVGTDLRRVRKFLAEIAALKTAAPPPKVCAGWRSIESAPKDGSRILLYRGAALFGLTVVIGQWDAGGGRPYWTHDAEEQLSVNAAREFQPTHWMPLPQTPEVGPPEVRAVAHLKHAGDVKHFQLRRRREIR